MCDCENCNMPVVLCLCSEINRCISCAYFDSVDGCTLEPPKDCIKEILI